MNRTSYGFSKSLNSSFESTLEKVTQELQKEGFGILTEIDVKRNSEKKIRCRFSQI